MHIRTLAGLLVLALCLLRPAGAEEAQQGAEAASAAESAAQHEKDAKMAWWRDARFGLFIHWGVYSVPAGIYEGWPIPGPAEWIMSVRRIPVERYRGFAKEFNPVKYDPEAWVAMAKEAGMKYIVITTKHHDGFALFDTKASDWNVVKATPFGKDLLKPLAEACQKHGIRLGFYYSQAQDWVNPGGASTLGHWDAAQEGSMDDYIEKVAVPQVREILSNYGPISLLWWDTPEGMSTERAEKLFSLAKLQPGIIMNNRLGGGFGGDTETPEQRIPATGFADGRDFEVCMTMNNSWGYSSWDKNWKSTESLVRNLVDIASKGGNYLLNVGPTSEGLVPEPSIERLREIGAWMKVNGDAIYGTQASPFNGLAWGRCTRKATPDGTTLYLHVFDWPESGALQVPGLKNDPTDAHLLADADRKPLTWKRDEHGITIQLPASAPSPFSSVVAVQIKGALDIESPAQP